MDRIFHDRQDAGRFLGEKLGKFADSANVIVLGLPRGGVPVAFEIARWIRAPLDIFIVRKLGVPGHEELAMGAIASGGYRVMNEDLVHQLGISAQLIDSLVEVAEREILRQELKYREARPPLSCHEKVVILVDDGLATGASMRAAITALRSKMPARIVIAVPVGSLDACRDIQHEADELVCGQCPDDFKAVGAWYEDFSQVTDDQVGDLLKLSSIVVDNPS